MSGAPSRLITTVVGARPQFVKCSLLSRALRQGGLTQRLVHTGQHYDPALSEVFFKELAIPEPDANLGIGSDTQGRQTGRMMIALEEDFEARRPDLVLVFGDTNSTLAAALVAVKLHIPLAHVESGLRSHNRTMPEEHNRVVTDHVADLLFCHNEQTARQLRAEGVAGEIAICGDTMRETLAHFLPLARERSAYPRALGLAGGDYALLTVHRPVNADDPAALGEILRGMDALGLPVVFPVHPRTRPNVEAAARACRNLRCIEPVGYLDMLALLHGARMVATDSGGLQKEALFAGTPCLTLRGETEWTETVELGLNTLAGDCPPAAEVARLAGAICAGALAAREARDPARLEEAVTAQFGPPDVSARITRKLAAFLAG